MGIVQSRPAARAVSHRSERRWLDRLQADAQQQAVVAVAAKIARILVVIATPGTTRGVVRHQPDPLPRQTARFGRMMTRELIDTPVSSAKKIGLVARSIIRERRCADLIMAWPQQRLTRERPDTFMQTGSST